MGEWQPIDSAPKDEAAPFLVYFDHDADAYYQPYMPTSLTDYGAIAEGGDFWAGKGVTVAVWRDGYHESEGYESGIEYWIPSGWFAWLQGDASDIVVNATHWQPLPEPPQ